MNISQLIERLAKEDQDRDVIVVLPTGEAWTVHGVEFNPDEGVEVMIVADEDVT